jgi:two-component system CheB/CheR fusion protein
MQIRPYKTVDNRIDGAILSLFDIHEMREIVGEAQAARKEAERANGAKDQFLAILSHELRTPLSSILLYAQLLRGGTADATKVKRAGEAIERGTMMQVRLIDDLLDMSRIITGKFHLEFQRLDLRTTVQAAVEDVNALAARKGVELTLQLDASPAMVSGDSVRLQQVVSNLLTNAIKFTPSKGRVTVKLAVSDGCARLSVADTGVGIEAGFLPHVFNRFAQGDTSSTRAHGGLGLGLAIVRHVLDGHGGTAQAESPGIGLGSTFSFKLPLAPASSDTVPPSEEALKLADKQAANGAPPHPDYSELRDVRILVVDDDRGVRDAVAEMLGRTSARVRVAASAIEAMAAVEEFRPEVVLCDIAMPGEDGYSFLRRLRARGPARGGDIPALAFTALAGDGDRRQALAAGFQMHLIKPVDIDHLRQAVIALVTGGARSSTSAGVQG